MKTLIIDWSPVAYGNLFSATNYIKTDKYIQVEKDENGKYNLDKYKDIVVQKIIEEISSLRNKFNLSQDDEIIIATDTSTKEGYWRKDIWAGYKSKRKDERDKSNVQWDKAFVLFQEVLEKLDKCTNLKVIQVPRTEGDDIIFVLSEYLQDKNDVIIYSSDHDMLQCVNENVKFWRTTRTQGMENSSFQEISKEEVKEIILDHIIGGDPGDGFYHIKSFSRFSDKFLKEYPHLEGKELQAYPKRFQIDQMFKKKHGEKVSAYNHPRYGYKTFKKSKKTLKEILKTNPIFEMNYQMNKELALPENIPDEIKEQIIKSYEREHGNDLGCFIEYLTDLGLFDLTSLVYLM